MIHPAQNVPAPDMGTGEREMAIIRRPIRADEHDRHQLPAPASPANRPTPAAYRAGSRRRAAGVQYALQEFFRYPEDVAKAGLSGKLDGKRVVVQGLGNVGYHAALFLSTGDGCKITHVIERDAPSKTPRGLDIAGLRDWIARHGGSGIGPFGTYHEDGQRDARGRVRHPHSRGTRGRDQHAQRRPDQGALDHRGRQGSRDRRAPTRSCATRAP